MDALADEIDCRPSARQWLRDPALALRISFGAMTAAQYRLDGEGAQALLARRSIMRLPIAVGTMERAVQLALLLLTAPVGLIATALGWYYGRSPTLF